MRRATFGAFVAGLIFGALAGCDFDAALSSYCVDTGRCDGGSVGPPDAGSGGGAGGGTGSAAGGGSGGASGGGTGGAAGGGSGGASGACTFTSLKWVGAREGLTGECETGIFSALNPDISVDQACPVPAMVTSIPPGVGVFKGASCGAPLMTGGTHSIQATRFGSYSWTATITDTRQTWTTGPIPYLARAELTVDAGTGQLALGRCNKLRVLATANGALVPANGAVPVTVSAELNGNFLPNCGETAFTENQPSLLIGVQPDGIGVVHLRVSGAGLDAGLATLTACMPLGQVCTTAAECCSGLCSSFCF